MFSSAFVVVKTDFRGVGLILTCLDVLEEN